MRALKLSESLAIEDPFKPGGAFWFLVHNENQSGEHVTSSQSTELEGPKGEETTDEVATMPPHNSEADHEGRTVGEQVVDGKDDNTFSRFQDLPSELRLMIWEFYYSGVRVHVVHEGSGIQVDTVPGPFTMHRRHNSDEDSLDRGCTSLDAGSNIVLPTGQPYCMINRQARSVAGQFRFCHRRDQAADTGTEAGAGTPGDTSSDSNEPFNNLVGDVDGTAQLLSEGIESLMKSPIQLPLPLESRPSTSSNQATSGSSSLDNEEGKEEETKEEETEEKVEEGAKEKPKAYDRIGLTQEFNSKKQLERRRSDKESDPSTRKNSEVAFDCENDLLYIACPRVSNPMRGFRRPDKLQHFAVLVPDRTWHRSWDIYRFCLADELVYMSDELREVFIVMIPRRNLDGPGDQPSSTGTTQDCTNLTEDLVSLQQRLQNRTIQRDMYGFVPMAEYIKVYPLTAECTDCFRAAQTFRNAFEYLEEGGRYRWRTKVEIKTVVDIDCCRLSDRVYERWRRPPVVGSEAD